MTAEDILKAQQTILQADTIAKNSKRDVEAVNDLWCDINTLCADLQADIDTTANQIRLDKANVDLSDARIDKIIKGSTIQERRLLRVSEGLYTILKQINYGALK